MQDPAPEQTPAMDEAAARSLRDANAPFVRLWQGFLTGRVLIAAALLLLQLALLGMQPGSNPLVWLVCLGYLGLTLLLRLTARAQPPSPRAGVHWLPVIGVDIVAISLLQTLQTGPLNYSALLAIPILISAVLGGLTLALATTASVTLLTLGWVAWQDLANHLDSTQAYYQASFACAGYFAVAYLTHELARRVRRERHLAQHSSRKARTQEQVNALVIRHLAEGVLVVDPQFRVQQANPAALRLLGLADGHGLPFALEAHAGWQRLQDAVAQSFAQNLPISAAVHLQSIGQEGMTGLHLRTWLTEVAAVPEAQDPDEPALLQQLCVVFLHDLRELEARLRTEKLASMGRMSAAVAHEIRNPLAAITQANALLSEDLAQEPAQQQLCRIVGQNAERLARIVEDVLNIARAQQHIGETHAGLLDLDQHVAQVCQEWQAQGQPARLVQLHLDAKARSVVFDHEHLRRILVNLMDNAQRYRSSAQDAHALQVLTGAPAAGQIWLQVWSDGAALEPTVQRHLFEPFFSSESRSSGLGLYICRELCQRYDAGISYQRLSRPTPRGLVEGNAFSIVFRAAPASALPASLFDQIVV
ncbi:Sensor protein ZraS [Delftia tsuruhatensis]|uniref:sensor histidine kinase n=1 Tax=Delftia tsuruhatensis TaxID=180282 RepID=UPI001E706476|nr:PAS domain-containing sensor histidine kinase [Delftia tsuruhatensis]CAB5701778.1 Sensor protein ZraS [Delftia tsuruhatensis]CAC9691439.1 Sensor protein ZraS [Delftia tsuruhatensis]